MPMDWTIFIVKKMGAVLKVQEMEKQQLTGRKKS